MKKIILLLSIFILLSSFIYGIDCDNLTTDIVISVDSEPYVNKVNDFLATLPVIYKTQIVKCWSYVSSVDGQVQQTNPQKEEYSETFFSLTKKEEPRDYFTAQNGIVNAYFTQKNLVSYTQFILGVRCVSETTGDVIMGEKCITPVYKELKGVTARTVWSVNNMDMLIIFFIFLLIALIFIGMYWRKFRKLVK